jgi:calcium/calmodulin-dependent protein kinase I
MVSLSTPRYRVTAPDDTNNEMEASIKSLYPVVQDLTDAEYGCCCCDSCALGSFSLEDLAIPVASPRTLADVPETPPCNCEENRVRHHRRDNSLTSLFSPRIDKAGHNRQNSAISSISGSGDSTTACTDLEEGVEITKFDEYYVLTRQVCILLICCCCCCCCVPVISLLLTLHLLIWFLVNCFHPQIFRCTFSILWECINRENGMRYCVKVIDRRRFASRADEGAALREIAMLDSLVKYKCPHVVSLVEIMEDVHHIYVITEHVEGGNLLTRINRQQEQRRPLCEEDVQMLARSLLEGVRELNSLNICHHDLQPENILVLPANEVQICDFGCATHLDGDSCCSCKGRFGNLSYTAPEVILAKRHAAPADIWSVGVILYYCLCGHLPFEDPSRRQLINKITKADFSFSGEEWGFVSRLAKQFVSNLLHADPQIRLTAPEALEHPWLFSILLSSQSKKQRRQGSATRRFLGMFGCRARVIKI